MIGEEVIAIYGDAGDGAELFEVQKLVRCESCKHWAYGKDLCTLHDMGMVSEDFCSYGEKSDE